MNKISLKKKVLDMWFSVDATDSIRIIERIIVVLLIAIFIFVNLALGGIFSWSDEKKDYIYGFTHVNSVSSKLILGSGDMNGNQVFTVYVGKSKTKLNMLQFEAQRTTFKVDDKYKEAPYVTYKYNSVAKQYGHITMYISEDTLTQSLNDNYKRRQEILCMK